MESAASALMFILTLSMLVAIVGIIRPFSGLSRGKFALIAIGCLVAAVIVTPAPTPQEIADREAKEKADAEAAEAAGLLAVQQWYDDVLATARPCDNVMAELGESSENVGRSGDTFTVYRTAERAGRLCKSAWLELRDIQLPADFPDQQEDEAEVVTEACRTALFLKKEAAEKAAEIFDGNFRNSAIADLQDLTQSAQADTINCVAGLVEVTVAAGVDLDEGENEPPR